MGRIPCSIREYTQYSGEYPAPGSILNTEKNTLLQEVYSIQWRIPCSRGYIQCSGGYPAPGSIPNTGEDTLLQEVYLIQWRIPCSRGYIQCRGGYPAPGERRIGGGWWWWGGESIFTIHVKHDNFWQEGRGNKFR